MESWEVLFWVVAGALALVGEVLTTAFFLLFFSLGAVVALCLALLGEGLAWQLIGLVVASLLGIAIVRPPLLRRLSLDQGEGYERRESIIGKSATVIGAIEPGASGTVRVGSGDFWTARALYSRQRIEVDSRVRILDIDGLTALVEPLESLERGE